VEGLYLACLEGLGIARLSEWNVREEVEMGRLRPIALEDANMPREAIWAVYPSLAFTPARVRMFIEAFRAHLR
jgi:DNA-binding transcriptional LysR family regulator